MKATHEPQAMNNDEQDVSQDPVWDLLRQSPAVPVSPVFADRVMRAVRQAEAQPSPFWARSYAVMGSVAAMAAALTIAAVMFFLPEPAQTVVEHRPEPADALRRSMKWRARKCCWRPQITSANFPTPSW